MISEKDEGQRLARTVLKKMVMEYVYRKFCDSGGDFRLNLSLKTILHIRLVIF